MSLIIRNLPDQIIELIRERLGRDDRAHPERREIWDAWLARDRRKVAALAQAHVAKTLDDLRQQLTAGTTRPRKRASPT